MAEDSERSLAAAYFLIKLAVFGDVLKKIASDVSLFMRSGIAFSRNADLVFFSGHHL
jgi:hypothetical protein